MILTYHSLAVHRSTLDTYSPHRRRGVEPAAGLQQVVAVTCGLQGSPCNLMELVQILDSSVGTSNFHFAKRSKGSTGRRPSFPLKYFPQIAQIHQKHHPATHRMTYPRLLSAQIQQNAPSRSQTKIFILARGSRRPLAPGQASR